MTGRIFRSAMCMLLTFSVLLLSACSVRNQGSSENSQTSGPVLLFEDNFDGAELDLTKWERCPQWDRNGELCAWRNSMSYLGGEGNLVLRSQWDSYSQRVYSGAIRSKGLFEHGFGYYEASIKFPKIKGVWGAFWMMAGNVSSEENGAKDGIEIDIVESLNSDTGVFNHALHWDGYGDAHKKLGSGKLSAVDIYDGNFHTFGLLRSENAYIFYVDGIETWRMSSFICAEKGYLIFSMEAADFAGANKDELPNHLPCEMIVDYVRVYSEKPE